MAVKTSGIVLEKDKGLLETEVLKGLKEPAHKLTQKNSLILSSNTEKATQKATGTYGEEIN